MDAICTHQILNSFSRWVGDSEVSVNVRKIGESSKISVRLTVISPQVTYGPPDAQLAEIACRAAIATGCTDIQGSQLSDFRLQKKNSNVREITFAFQRGK